MILSAQKKGYRPPEIEILQRSPLLSAGQAGQNPIFQVVLALQNAPGGPLELPGLTLTPEPLDVTVTRFDLELHLWEEAGVLAGAMVYDADRRLWDLLATW